jgi:hypothetical protein
MMNCFGAKPGSQIEGDTGLCEPGPAADPIPGGSVSNSAVGKSCSIIPRAAMRTEVRLRSLQGLTKGPKCASHFGAQALFVALQRMKERTPPFRMIG